MSEPVWAAKYSGLCPACRTPIAQGDSLTWRQDGEAVHARCAAPVCPVCHLQLAKSGRCDSCDD